MKKKTTNPRRLTLRGWAAIDDLRKSIDSAAREGEWSRVPESIFQIIELTVDKFDRESFWSDVADLFTKVIQANSPTKNFPILSTREKGKEMPWEYEGRGWYFWLNLFATNYGWDVDKISNLDIDDAIALFQEITIDQQLGREWEYGLSELAYVYNKATKQSHFRAMPRPDWMRGMTGKPKPVRERKIHKNAMPMGEIIILDEQPPNTVQ